MITKKQMFITAAVISNFFVFAGVYKSVVNAKTVTNSNLETTFSIDVEKTVNIKNYEGEYVVAKTETDSTINGDVICLAQNIYHEARGENYEGKVLVAQVTLNRVKHKRWGNTICDVVYQKHQFEWVDLKMFLDMSTQKERNSFIESIEIAQAVIDNDIDDISHGANHYFNPKTVANQPSWHTKMALVAVNGNHNFYRE